MRDFNYQPVRVEVKRLPQFFSQILCFLPEPSPDSPGERSRGPRFREPFPIFLYRVPPRRDFQLSPRPPSSRLSLSPLKGPMTRSRKPSTAGLATWTLA